jgi:zinc/manganese transport system substrate-binding protein
MHRRSMLAGFALAPLMARAEGVMCVVASFSILADLTRQIAHPTQPAGATQTAGANEAGGPAVQVDALVGPDADVHLYEPTPADLRALMRARLLVTNGLRLEGWMDRLTGAARFNGITVVAAEKVVPRTMKEQGGAVATDPHAWQDPRNAILYVDAITKGLAAADPVNATFYHESASRYAGRIAEADAWIASRLASVPQDQRRIITTHDAFGYYGARYGVEFLSPEGISTEFEPSAKSIAGLVAQIRKEKVRAVFIENMTSARMARMLAQETGAVLGGTVYSDALSPAGGPAASYLDMLHHNTNLFAEAMRPR